MFKGLIIECILCFPSPLPFLYNSTFEETAINFNDVKIEHFYNDLLQTWSFVRIYLVLRCILANSYYMSSRSQRVCQMNGHSSDYMFAIKCFMIESPYLVMANNLVLSMFYFGYLMRIFDSKLSSVSGQDFDTINNPVWMSIVTMTTVGYGDFFPKSTPSRIIGIMCAFYGVFQVSLFVIALDNLLEFNSAETRSYSLIKNLSEKEELRMQAIHVITTSYRHKKAVEGHMSESYILSKLRNFRARLLVFNSLANAIRGGSKHDCPTDRVKDEISELRETVFELNGPIEKLKKYIEKTKNKATSSTEYSDNNSNKLTKSGEMSAVEDTKPDNVLNITLSESSDSEDVSINSDSRLDRSGDASENSQESSEKSSESE